MFPNLTHRQWILCTMALRESHSQDPKFGTFCHTNSRICKVWKLSKIELKIRSLKTVLVEFARFKSAMLKKEVRIISFYTVLSIPFAQVLHDGRMHWAAIRTYGCDLGKIYLMDSLLNGRIAEHKKKQICSILNCAVVKIKNNVLPVQQQSNGVDCGIYTLAFCFDILSKRTNPMNIFF